MDQNSGFHGNRKRPLTYNGENYISTFSLLFLIRSFLNLQVTRTGIKSQTSSNFSQIGPLPTELGALERQISLRFMMENGVSKLACSFLIGSLSNLLVTRTGIKSQTSSNSSRIGSVTSVLGFGADWIKTCGCHGNPKLPLTYNGENGISTFSQSFLNGYSLNLQVSKTGIKSQMSSNSRWIGSFASVLLALSTGQISHRL